MAFADRLKEARLKKNYTQEQIAKKIGVAKSTYTGYEKGNREPNVNTIGKLMEELGVDANFLWQDETTFPFELTYDEMENLVKKYRNLDDHGKDLVNTILEKENTRCFDYTISKTNDPSLFIEYDATTAPIDRLATYANAAHAIPNVSLEDKQHDEDIMDDPDF